MTEHRVGLDIGGTSTKAAWLIGGHVHRVARSGPYARPDAATVRAAMETALRGLDLPGSHQPWIGVATPGVRDAAGTTVLRAVNVPGLVGMNLSDAVRACVPSAASVRVIPDTLAAAYGHWVSAGRGLGRLLALVLGTGVGACVLDAGVPLHVRNRGPGHFGQIDVGDCGLRPVPIGPDGGRGSLEAYIGYPALRARFGDDGLASMGDDDPSLVALARAIRVGLAIYGPDEVALLGGVGAALLGKSAAIEALIRHELSSVAPVGWRLVLADSVDLGVVGAALLAKPDE